MIGFLPQDISSNCEIFVITLFYFGWRHNPSRPTGLHEGPSALACNNKLEGAALIFQPLLYQLSLTEIILNDSFLTEVCGHNESLGILEDLSKCSQPETEL